MYQYLESNNIISTTDKKEQTINHDNTISWDSQIIQIPPTDIRLSFAKSKVDVCLLEDNLILVL